jgi:hypothetical protein
MRRFTRAPALPVAGSMDPGGLGVHMIVADRWDQGESAVVQRSDGGITPCFQGVGADTLEVLRCCSVAPEQPTAAKAG